MNSTPALSMNPTPDTPYLSKLNPEQREAVEATEGPVLVLAGAGTGKTRVLTTRIAHILRSGLAYPGQILAVTFTNKAAKEMGHRVAELVGHNPEASPVGNQSLLQWLGTFHSIGARILRRHAEIVGLTSNFTILDEDDQLRLIKAILGEKNIDEKANPPKLFGAIISRWKDRGLTPDKVTGSDITGGTGDLALGVYHAYQQRLKTLNAADFGDLLLHNLTIFTQRPELLQEYARRFKYILVDEYQDTNVSQYLWLRLLASAHKNICCVGDDDQSIYSWRGAEVGNILKFEKDFPGAHIIRLERNYRSTPHILGAASELIAHNKGRMGKTLWTESKDEADQLRVKPVWDDAEEARFIGDEIETLQRTKHSLNEIAILVRAGFQTRAFEERFITLGIPYRVIGGLRFYERQEIRDAIAYLRVISQPDDDLAFERIINTPRRGIGKATLEQLHTTARNLNISLTRATNMLLENGSFSGKLGISLRALMQHFERWRGLLDTTPLAEVTDLMLAESGYRAMWQEDKSPDAQGRLENLRELVQAMGEFETLQAFLEHVGLVMDRNDASTDDMVSLMTLHAAKGLEWHSVFLPGWEEGLFPHQRSLDESGSKGLEEERRLAYVGITRARRRVTITHAANRRIYNQWQSSLPSRFVDELPEKHVMFLPGGAFGSNQPAAGFGRRMAAAQQVVADRQVHNSRPSSAYPPGTRVFHMKFGYGHIISASGDHLEIAFEKAGMKKVMAGYVDKV